MVGVGIKEPGELRGGQDPCGLGGLPEGGGYNQGGFEQGTWGRNFRQEGHLSKGVMLLPQTTLQIQLSPQAGSRAAGLGGPEGSRRGQLSDKSRTEGCGRLPARRKCSDFNVIINNNHEAVRMSIRFCTRRYQALHHRGWSLLFLPFSRRINSSSESKDHTLISAKARTESQVHVTPRPGPWLQ